MLRIPIPEEHGGADVRSMYQDALELAVAADQLGFDSLWVTQHHFGAIESALPSPLVFLAAVAARTKRIRLGTTVVTASLEHPVRLAEDAATLDVLSGGRVELGLGTSSSETERVVFGVSAGEQRLILHRTALTVVDALEGKPMGGVPDAILQPHTPTLSRRMWMATATMAHARFAAAHGFGLITNYQPETMAPENRGYIDEYCDSTRKLGLAPRVGLSRGVFPTLDTAGGRRLLEPHAARFVERGRRCGWLSSSFAVDDYFEREDFHFGHPDHVIARLSRDPGLPYATELLTGMLSARLTPRDLMPVLERIALDVAPALGWRRREGRIASD